MSDTNFLMVAIIAGGIAGLICGLFPLIIGLVMKQNNLAIGGIIACIIAGMILGLIAAIPTALGFTIAIAMKGRDARKAKVDNYDF